MKAFLNIRAVLILCLVLQPLLAHSQFINPAKKESFRGGNEYFVGAELGKPLITVNVTSGVTSPGVYHIPIGSNLAELISYSGGYSQNADMENVTVRTLIPNGEPIIKVYDFNSLVRAHQGLPVITDKDVVHIEHDQGLDRTLKWLSLGALTTSIISTIVILNDRND